LAKYIKGSVYFTANILAATDRLQLLCRQSKIRSRGMTRHTICPVSARTAPVLKALSQHPGQSTKMSQLGIQSARMVPHSGVARLSAALSTHLICLQ